MVTLEALTRENVKTPGNTNTKVSSGNYDR